MIKPSPQRIECRRCGWYTVFAPRSDALVMPPPDTCEKCDGTDLIRSPASMLDEVFSSLSSVLKNK